VLLESDRGIHWKRNLDFTAGSMTAKATHGSLRHVPGFHEFLNALPVWLSRSLE
jgi:hypothetical protein